MGITEFSTGELGSRTVFSSDGEVIGNVSAVHTDQLGRPQYVEVRTGWFGARRHVIPVHGLATGVDGIVVPFTSAMLHEAPTLDPGDHLTFDREMGIGEHYGIAVREWDDTRDHWLRWMPPAEPRKRSRASALGHEDAPRHLQSAQAESGAVGAPAVVAPPPRRLRLRRELPGAVEPEHL